MTPDDPQARIAAYQRKRNEFEERIRALFRQEVAAERAGDRKRAASFRESRSNLDLARQQCCDRITELALASRPAPAPLVLPSAAPDPLAGLPLFAGMEVSR